jgi:ABC-type nitrate/sulfonate/bicarbonate transport system substrate-binding protein
VCDRRIGAREEAVQNARHLSCVVAATLALLALTPRASAEDVLKLAIAQRGAWASAVPELGQQAGIFKKHGIELDLLYAEDSGETELPRVISGSVDVGLGVGLMGVLRAYAKGAPVRIIGASATGSANYWYVPATSPIKTIKDINGKTIAYPTSGEASRYDVFDFMKQYNVRAKPMPTADAAATLDAVTSGRIDVGWATPPFGIDAIEQGQIRIVARANDVPSIRDKTIRVLIANTDTLQKRKDVLARFMEAYRETLEWMYSDPTALKRYAEFAGVSEGFARRLRDEFFAKNLLSPDKIIGLKAIVKDAVALSYIRAPLAKKQVTELIQIPAARGIGAWFRIFPPQLQ